MGNMYDGLLVDVRWFAGVEKLLREVKLEFIRRHSSMDSL